MFAEQRLRFTVPLLLRVVGPQVAKRSQAFGPLVRQDHAGEKLEKAWLGGLDEVRTSALSNFVSR